MRTALRRLRETSAFQDNLRKRLHQSGFKVTLLEGAFQQPLKFMQWETDFAQHPSVTAVPWHWPTQSAG